MRIVGLADTHLSHCSGGPLQIPDGDVFVHAGDAPQHGDLEDAGFLYLEDASMVIDGLVFYGAPWQPKCPHPDHRGRIWAFGAKRGPELAAKWKKIPDRVDVLVTHGPPHGFGDRIEWGGVLRRVGCVDLAERVREVEPSLHLFGHIHQDAGLWVEGPTTYANVTTDEGVHPASVFDVIRTRPSERPAIRPLPRRTPAP